MQKPFRLFSALAKGASILLQGTMLVIVVGFIGLFILLGILTPKKLPEKAKELFFSHKALFEKLRQMISSEPRAYCISDERGQLAIGPYYYNGSQWQLIRSDKAVPIEEVYSRMAISTERFAEYRRLLKEIDFQSVHKNLISDSDLPFADELQSSNNTIPDKVYLQKLIHAKPSQLFISFRCSPRSLPSYIDYIPNNRAIPRRDVGDEPNFEQLENHWFLEP